MRKFSTEPGSEQGPEGLENILGGIQETVGRIKSAPDSGQGVIVDASLAPPTQPSLEGSYVRSLDEAANLLLNILTPSVRDYAFELADHTLHIPRWQLLLGSLAAQHECGTLQAPSIDPSWRQVTITPKAAICAIPSCQKEFAPKRFGEKYCSPKCGNEARRLEIDQIKKRRAAEIKFQKDQQRAQLGGGGDVDQSLIINS